MNKSTAKPAILHAILPWAFCCMAAWAPSQGAVIGWGNTTLPGDLGSVSAIYAGSNRASAVKPDGSMLEWPANGQPAGLTGVIAVAEGNYHTLALKADGTVVAWGWNSSGQCNVPSAATKVVAIAAGCYYSLALKADGTLVEWGSIAPIPAGLNGVVAIAGGFDHCLALRSDGTVVGWGNNEYGQSSVPASVTGVVAIAAGRQFSLALRANGTVAAWGIPNAGVLPSNLANVVAISASEYHSLALRSNGTVVVSAPGLSATLPPPAGLSGITAIAQGGSFCLAGKLAPITVGHSYQVGADGSFFGTPGVLAGSNSVGSAVLVAPTQHGLVDLSSDGAFSYFPDPGFYGQDSFSYKATNTYGTSRTQVASLAVAMNLRGFSLTPASVVGGNTSVGWIAVGPAPSASPVSVALSCDNPKIVCPQTVTVPVGATMATFRLPTAPIDDPLVAHITALLGTKTLVATFTVMPAGLLKVVLDPPVIVGGAATRVYVYLNGKAGPSGALVRMTSWDGEIDGGFFIPSGQSANSFLFRVEWRGTEYQLPVTAIYRGESKGALLTVELPSIVKMALSANPVVGGATVTCTVSLNGDPGGWDPVAKVSSDNLAAVVPTSVTFYTITASFTIKTSKVTAQTLATITVDGGARGKMSTVLTINP